MHLFVVVEVLVRGFKSCSWPKCGGPIHLWKDLQIHQQQHGKAGAWCDDGMQCQWRWCQGGRICLEMKADWGGRQSKKLPIPKEHWIQQDMRWTEQPNLQGSHPLRCLWWTHNPPQLPHQVKDRIGPAKPFQSTQLSQEDQGEALIHGFLIHGLWARGMDWIINVCITDADAKSNCSRDPLKVLTAHKCKEKKKYLEACLEQHQHFIHLWFPPMAFLARKQKPCSRKCLPCWLRNVRNCIPKCVAMSTLAWALQQLEPPTSAYAGHKSQWGAKWATIVDTNGKTRLVSLFHH
jgi:hypothetical protein